MAEDIKFNIKAEVSDAVKSVKELTSVTDDLLETKNKVSSTNFISTKDLDALRLGISELRKHKINIDEMSTALNGSASALRNFDADMDTVLFQLSKFGKTISDDKTEIVNLNHSVDYFRSKTQAAEKGATKTAAGMGNIANRAKQAAKGMMSLDLVTPFVKFTSVAAAAQAVVVSFARAVKDAFAGATDWQLQIQEARQFGLEFKNTQEIIAASAQLAVKYASSGAQEVEALQKAAAVGYKDLAEAYEIVDKANLLVAGSGARLSEGVQALTGVMKSYNLEISEVGQVTDLLYKLTRNTNIGFTELSDAFSRGAQAAGALGIDLKEVLAISTVLNRTGMKSNETFTATRALIESLANPTERARKAITALNTELTQAGKENVAVGAQAVSNKGVMGVLFGIQNAAKGLGKSNAQVQELIKNVTGLTRASTPAFAILKTGAKEANEVLKDLGQSAAAAAEGFALIQKSLSFQTKQKTSAFMTGLEEGWEPLTEFLGELLAKFDATQFETFGRDITSTLTIIGASIVSAVEMIFKGIGFIWDSVGNSIDDAFDYAINKAHKLKAWWDDDFDELDRITKQEEKASKEQIARDTALVKKFNSDIDSILKSNNKTVSAALKALFDPESYKAELAHREKQIKTAEKQANIQKELTEAEKKLAENANKQVASLEKEYALLGKNAKQKKIINTFDKLGVDTTKLIVDETGKIVKGYETLTPELQNVYEWLQKILLKQDDIAKVEEKRKDLTDWSEGGGQRQSLLDFYDNYKESMLSLGDVLTNAFSNVEDSIVDFCRTGKLSFSDMVDSMIEDLLRLMIQQQMAGFAKGISSFFTPSNSTFTAAAFAATAASGGYIQGPGTGTSDSIPAWLSNGEFVMNAQATAKYLPLLKQMNENKFAKGGLVGNSSAGNGVDIQVIDQRGSNAAPIQTSQQQGPDGRKMIKMLVRDTVRQGFANGSYDSSMQTTYGIRRAAYQR